MIGWLLNGLPSVLLPAALPQVNGYKIAAALLGQLQMPRVYVWVRGWVGWGLAHAREQAREPMREHWGCQGVPLACIAANEALQTAWLASQSLQGNHDNLVSCGDEQASPSKSLVAQVYQRFFDAKVRSSESHIRLPCRQMRSSELPKQVCCGTAGPSLPVGADGAAPSLLHLHAAYGSAHPRPAPAAICQPQRGPALEGCGAQLNVRRHLGCSQPTLPVDVRGVVGFRLQVLGRWQGGGGSVTVPCWGCSACLVSRGNKHACSSR